MFSLKRKKSKSDAEDDDSPSGRAEEARGKAKKRRGKKKEEKKPWGKGERYLVFGVLTGSIVVSLVLALYARSWKLPGLPRIALPEETFEETFVLEGKEVDQEVSKNLNKRFNQLTINASGVYGVYVIDLFSGESFGVAEDEVFQAASLIKLPVLSLLYEEAEKRRIDLDEIYSVEEEDKVAGAGALYYEEEGYSVTYRQMAELMGKQSDNTAYNIVLNTLGKERVQEYIEEIGMRETSLEKNMTTPRDIGLYFKKLWEGRLVNSEHREELLSYLTDTAYEKLIPEGIPDDEVVAHKYGAELHVLNDAGVVRTSKPYVLVIMSKGILEKEAFEIIPQIASLIHSEFGQN